MTILEALFVEEIESDCVAALDTDGTRIINITDVVVLLSAIFRRGAAPSPPYPDCGRYGGVYELPPCERQSCGS